MGFESPHTGRGTCEGDTLGFSRRNQLMRRCCAKPGFPRQTIPRLLLMRQDITTRRCCLSPQLLWSLVFSLTTECILTGAEVDDEVEQKERVWDAVEGDPVCAEVVVKEGDDDGKNDEIGNQQVQHKQIPVEPGTDHSCKLNLYSV